MAKSVVSIVKGTDAEKMVTEALDLLGGVTSLIKPNSTVIVKPNCGHKFGPETSVNTSPAVVAAVIKEIRKANPKEIILAEAAATGQDTLLCFEASGQRKAAEDAGVDKIIDIKRDKDLIRFPIRDARSGLTQVLLPRFLIEADHIVNLPIFKSHVAMVFTGALKNLKGVVQDKFHQEMHRADLGLAMLDLWSIIRPDLQIVDMIRPAEGFGPLSTLPVDFGCIVAGKDPVAVDATACRMVGLDVDRVTCFKAARERRFGNIGEKSIEIRGKKIEEVFQQMWCPYMGGFEQWPEYHILSQGCCSSCQGLIAVTLERMKATNEYKKNAGVTIVAGPKKELPKGVNPKDLILFGDCVRKYKDQGVYIRGCPPSDHGPYWNIVERKGTDETAEFRAANPEASKKYAVTQESEQEFIDYAIKERNKAIAGKKSVM